MPALLTPPAPKQECLQKALSGESHRCCSCLVVDHHDNSDNNNINNDDNNNNNSLKEKVVTE
jgi:hypothetical protein